MLDKIANERERFVAQCYARDRTLMANADSSDVGNYEFYFRLTSELSRCSTTSSLLLGRTDATSGCKCVQVVPCCTCRIFRTMERNPCARATLTCLETSSILKRPLDTRPLNSDPMRSCNCQDNSVITIARLRYR